MVLISRSVKTSLSQPIYHNRKDSALVLWLMKQVCEEDNHELPEVVLADEQSARSEDDFLRELENPHHWRIEPILQFLEKDVWVAYHEHGILYVKPYEQGYRSLGARVTTQKADSKPAWEQDLENTTEWEGRRQDKEKGLVQIRVLKGVCILR